MLVGIVALVAAGLPTPAGANPGQTAHVTAVQYQLAADRVRITLSLDARVKYTDDVAFNPFRLFFDLPETVPSSALNRNVWKINDPLLHRIRLGENQPGITRLVLELEKPVAYTVSVRSDPPRLEVEILRTGSPSPPQAPQGQSSRTGATLPAPTAAANHTTRSTTQVTIPSLGRTQLPSQPAGARPVAQSAAVHSQAARDFPGDQRNDPCNFVRATNGANAAAATAYRDCAARGSAEAQFQLGNLYMSGGSGLRHDSAEAVRWYTLAAQQGHAVAASNLGVLYAKGDGTPQAYSEAARWFRRAAEQGDPGGQANLGALYIQGRGVPPDDGEGAKWLRLAAEKGVAEAQYSLGTLYANGRGVPRDPSEAAQWLQRAADQNYAPAKLTLGKMYAAGNGVMRDPDRAMNLFRSADLPEAWYEIGMLYLHGEGTAKNEAEAAVWFLKAAEKGVAEANYAVGSLLLGHDPAAAYSWFAVAAARGYKQALPAMNTVAAHLSAEELADAQQRALKMAQTSSPQN